MEENPYLCELRQKKRAARILESKYASMRPALEEIYERIKTERPTHPQAILSWQQELADYEADLEMVQQEKSRVAQQFVEYHRLIATYKKNHPSSARGS